MKNMYDVIVIGLGIMGASALWRVALKCNRVLGIDASGPTHRHGSSQGESRIFRRAYWEGDKYLPLLNHANLLWNELEQSIMTQLLYRTGGLFIGSRSSQIIAGSIHTARQGNIEHEIWDSSTIIKNAPAFKILNGMQAVFEPDAYAIAAREARLNLLNESIRYGATTEFGDHVVDIENNGAGLRIRTRRGRILFAKSVIVTTGPWITNTLPSELRERLEPRQVPVYWFKPTHGFEHLFSPNRFPVFLYEFRDQALLYGVPSITSNEPGVKIGFHNRQQTPATPEWKDVPVQKIHLQEISKAVGALFPELEYTPIQAKNCFYTISADESFLIGESQALKSTYYASACSGHGFKFAPAIGDALANMAVGQKPLVSLTAFSANRFESTS